MFSEGIDVEHWLKMVDIVFAKESANSDLSVAFIFEHVFVCWATLDFHGIVNISIFLQFLI